MTVAHPPDPAPPGPSGNWRQRLFRHVAEFAALLVVAVAAIAVAVRITPAQTVSVAGQVITVGATAPSLSLSGPGEVDLFGQSLPTTLRFPGPLRPRLALSQITINSELTNFVRGAAARAPSAPWAAGWRTGGPTISPGRPRSPGWGRWSCSARWRAAPAAAPHDPHAARGRPGGDRGHQRGRDHHHRVPGAGPAEAGELAEPAGGQRAAPQVHVKGRPLPEVQAVVMGTRPRRARGSRWPPAPPA